MDPFLLSKVINHYKGRAIQDEIIFASKNREVGAQFMDRFGKRPDALLYSSDIIDFVKRGVTSFHISEERWENPLEIRSDMSKKELCDIREGWDLVIDIDCKFWNYSKIAAEQIIRFLQVKGIESISCKFSGNKGFHLGVPFESFPKEIDGIKTKSLFPEAARKMAYYIKEYLHDDLSKEILSFEGNDISKIKERSGLEIDKLLKKEGGKLKLNVDNLLEIDTILISSRHLFRAPYSINEKSWLVSVPLNIDRIMKFDKKSAVMGRIEVNKSLRFLDPKNSDESEGRRLLAMSLDYGAKELPGKAYMDEKKGNKIDYNNDGLFFDEGAPISEDHFPPCIKKIFEGLEDGRKRSVFILINFLRSINWPKEKVEERLLEWNKSNPQPLGENFIRSQTGYHFRSKEKFLPPNCDNEGFYTNIEICNPDTLCRKIKNPAAYVRIRYSRNKDIKK